MPRICAIEIIADRLPTARALAGYSSRMHPGGSHRRGAPARR
jgi:hypothetical protein